MSAPRILLGFTFLTGTFAADLFTFVSNPPVGPEKIKACTKEFLSCSVVEVNFGALDDAVLTLPGDWVLSLLDVPAEGSTTFTDSSGTEATFTRHKTAEGHFKVIGNVEFPDGRDFMMEPCRVFHGCHVWKEADPSTWRVESAPAVAVMEEEKRYAELNRRTADPAKVQQGKDDNTTIVTYTAMFYYTPEFAASTEDIPLFISQVIAETNQGYINSKVPLRIATHCVQEIDLHDISAGYEMLDAFKASKPIAELLNTADIAHLFVDHFSYCGIATLGSFMWGNTVGVTMKSCALGIYTVGHEIGHNFGCLHDPIQGANPYYSYGLGSHIPGTDKMTIMAYGHGDNNREINYYSAPDVFYQGIVTGSEEQNNARVLREHRFAMADIGDESGSCDLAPTGAPTTGGCKGGDTCCYAANCGAGEGDCDKDSDCRGALTCGEDNCKTGWGGDRSTFDDNDDCCVEPAPGTTGELTSGNHPSEYANNLDTEDTILVEEGGRINIRIDALDIESHASCAYDNLQILDGNSSILLEKTCGSDIPEEFVSFTNKVKVIFHTDYSVTKSGWKLTWTALLPLSGEVQSENYPAEYSNDLDKTYNIQVDAGKKIKISFDHLNIESHSSCVYDYVMVADGDGTVLVPKTCGTTKPADVTTTSNTAVVTFHSDYSVTKTGFHLTWTEA